MKCPLVFSIVLVAVTDLCFAGLTPDKLKEIKPLIDACIKSSQVTEDTIDKLHSNHEIPTLQSGKCFIACMSEQMKVMKDGKFDQEMTMEFIDKAIPDKDKAAEVKKTAEECLKSLPDTGDKCEMAADLATCLKDHHATLAGMN